MMTWMEAVVAYWRQFSGICLRGLSKRMKTLRVVGVSAGIRTEFFPNATPAHNHYTKLLGDPRIIHLI
jgi:hypothetical protein